MKTFELSGRLGEGKFAIVDDEDYERVIKNKWYWEGRYVIQYLHPRDGSTIRLHRLILNAQKGSIVDHINHNPLDNRKENLRFCTTKQNLWNRVVQKKAVTGLKGVAYDSRRKTYIAYITLNGKKTYLGYFKNKGLAAQAYNKAAMEHHGVFAYLNPVIL